METHKKWQNITASTLAQVTALKYLPLRAPEDASLWVTFCMNFFKKSFPVENLDCECVAETESYCIHSDDLNLNAFV